MERKAVSRRPSSTYRLQLRSGLTLRKLRTLTDYFHTLGISDLYLSPVSRADSASPHGYAVVDFDGLDPRIGSIEELAQLASDLSGRDMGLLLDFVSNHMYASPMENRWWRDVMETGPRSPFASFFDIDWSHRDPELRGRVLAPVLGESFEEALENGALPAIRTMDGLFVAYHRLHFPLAPWSWSRALEAADVDDPELRTLLSAMEAFEQTPGTLSRAEWTEKERLKQRALARIHASEPLVARIDEALAQTSSAPVKLRALLGEQTYLLSHYREASSRINYRRFFDVNDLAALRVEDPEVFAATHDLVFRLMEQGFIQGLRIDHVDGLADPKDYLEKLPPDRYVVVEKILDRHERLPADWRVEGTTGYDALNRLQRLFVHPSGEEELRALFRELTSETRTFHDIVHESKLEVLQTSFGAELTAIAELLLSSVRETAGFETTSLEDVRDSLAALVASFSVYRTYRRPGEKRIDEWDARVLGSAQSAAKRAHPEREELLDRIGVILSGDAPSPAVLRLQQLTGAVMAKGVEDTAFYRCFPLVSLNEVGGGPVDLESSLDEFHERNRETALRWPFGLTATSTHDAKRDEDVRSRIHVLSEIPDEWRQALGRWREWNRRHKRFLPKGEAPDESEEYFLYQTLLGTWPLTTLDAASHREYVERITSYMTKALREAKRHTSWLDPDDAYEAAANDFVAKLLDPKSSLRFLDDFARFESVVRRPGLLNAVSQTVLKCTMPGVPDFYQGTETWGLRLVDPDNRRPVDFEGKRKLLLAVIDDVERDGDGGARFLGRALESLEDGRLKMYVTWRLLTARRERRPLFGEGEYLPLDVEGERGSHVVAFARKAGRDRVLVAAGRFFTRLPSPPVGKAAWGGARLRIPKDGGTRYREILSGGSLRARAGAIALAAAFRDAPFAVLEESP